MNPNLRVCVDRTGLPWVTFGISQCSVKGILGRWELDPQTRRETALELLRGGLLPSPACTWRGLRTEPCHPPSPHLMGEDVVGEFATCYKTNTLTAPSPSCQRDLRVWPRWGLGGPQPLVSKETQSSSSRAGPSQVEKVENLALPGQSQWRKRTEMKMKCCKLEHPP